MENVLKHKTPQPIVLLGATYVALGFNPDEIADVIYYALKKNLNVADELKNNFTIK